MKRGPKPKPLQAVSPRRRQARLAALPQPGPGEPPEWLAGPALEIYRRYRAMLAAAGIGADCDAEALARLSCYLAAWREAETAEAAKLETAIVRLEREFGLTPASRRGLAAAPSADAAAQIEELGIQR